LQRQLTFIQVALRVSLISEHEDVIPSEITACQGTTVETTQRLPPVYQSNLPLLAIRSF